MRERLLSAGGEHAPATARNRALIIEVLRRVLPESGLVLEIGSGTGEHVLYFAEHLPGLVWQPSEVDSGALASTAAWRTAVDLPNLLAPIELDARAAAWPVERADAVIAINVIHIAPWATAEGLFAGAARLLSEGAKLYLYGPFMVDGRHTAPSNDAFDRSLKAQNSAWGLRGLAEVAALGRANGFAHTETVSMPVNNLSVVFSRTG